ncbi:MAG: S-methyl-5-thioribose-1-phosphate isomerase [Brevinematales bacterium]|nr:S-methyl-5-thioribose-1-phosphate isomerase [Brevinematales bacterium]
MSPEPVIRHIYLDGRELVILDQRALPSAERLLRLKNAEEIYDAIKTLAVRGAPAIGIAAAYGVYVHLANQDSFTIDGALAAVNLLKSARPTAYNLFYTLGRQEKIIRSGIDSRAMLDRLRDEALRIHREDLEQSARIAEYGAGLIHDGDGIIGHCNAGGLATGGNGTSLALIYGAHRAGKHIRVYVDETRPLLQGARLTAWELERAGVPYEIITDSMAGAVMQSGMANIVLVGADRIAMNGDFANKIGTYSLAVLAKYHGIGFYTAAPVSTFDPDTTDGKSIPIEQRDPIEVLEFAGVRTAPKGANAYNPAFDVTPSELLSGIVCDRGLITPPFAENIIKMRDQELE